MVLQNTFRKMFAVREEVLNVSQKTAALKGISPPLFIRTGLQKYRGDSFFHSSLLHALQYHLFRNGAVLMYSDSEIDPSRASPNSTELSVEMTFALVVDGSRYFRELFSVP